MVWLHDCVDKLSISFTFYSGSDWLDVDDERIALGFCVF